MENHKTILREVSKLLTPDKRFILGIDGLSRSGKTTLCAKVKKSLEEKDIKHVIFHIDDHIVERNRRYHTGVEQWVEYYSKQWDAVWLRNHFFAQVKEAECLALPFYDSEIDRQFIKQVDLAGTSICIIEGVFLQRSEWKGFFDFVVYLDTPKEIRFERENGLAQQDLEKMENRYWKAEDYYLKERSPIENADLVLRG